MNYSLHDFDTIQKLLKIAMSQVVDVFSQTTNEQYVLDSLITGPTNANDWHTLLKPNPESEHFFLLTTQIKGKAEGITYLWMPEQAAKKIIETLVSEANYKVGQALSELQEAALLEFDNIVSGAFVSQLADFTNQFIYGHVPMIQNYTLENTIFALKKYNLEAKYQSGLYVYAQIKSCTNADTYTFICFFAADFFLPIKQMPFQEKHLSLLKS